MKRFLQISVLFYILHFTPSYSQVPNGPGGVGSTNGTTSLRLWLDAGDLNGNGNYGDNPAVGTLVSSFVDKSGCGYNLDQATANNRPTYDVTTYPNVFFQNSAAYNKNLFNSTAVNLNPGSLFYVLSATDVGNNSNVIFDDAVISLRYEQDPFTNVIGYTHYGIMDYTTTIASVFGSYLACSFHKQSAASGSLTIKLGSSSQTITIGTTDYIPIGQLGKSTISPLGTDDPVHHTVEIIAHNVYLNTAQQKIIENYVSAKYGSFPIPNDIYLMDNAANGNFDFDVAGIGRDNSTNLHADAQGTGIVRFLNPSNLGDNEYFIWGHNNGALANTLLDVPAGVVARYQRVWRPTEVGDVGNLTVRFNVAGPVVASNLRLLIDLNNNGLFADDLPISGATSLGGGVFEFSAIPQFANALRFTLGTTNIVTTPLPVELVSFDVSCDQHTLWAKWVTASESNNQYFSIENSSNAIDWAEVATNNGAGISNASLVYQLELNRELVTGNYFRLKQVDFDGNYTVYDPIYVQDLCNSPDPVIYPNPNEGTLYIQDDHVKDLHLYNMLGQEMAVIYVKEPNGIMKAHIESLAPGVYILHLEDTFGKVWVKSIVKK